MLYEVITPWTSSFTFDNYKVAAERADFGNAYLNSLVISIVVTLVVILIAGFAAYALVRYRITSYNVCYTKLLRYGDRPKANEQVKKIGRNLDGCRIGFDAGGSDRKVSAVIDGKCVFSEEVVWFPKTASDPQYHRDGILSSLKAAAAHMPRIDAIGVSAAGIYVDNRTAIASLFRSVGKVEFEKSIRNRNNFV